MPSDAHFYCDATRQWVDVDESLCCESCGGNACLTEYRLAPTPPAADAKPAAPKPDAVCDGSGYDYESGWDPPRDCRGCVNCEPEPKPDAVGRNRPRKDASAVLREIEDFLGHIAMNGADAKDREVALALEQDAHVLAAATTEPAEGGE